MSRWNRHNVDDTMYESCDPRESSEIEVGDTVMVIGSTVSGKSRLAIGTKDRVLFGNSKVGLGVQGYLYPEKSLMLINKNNK